MPEVTEPLIIAVSHLLTIDDPQTLSLPGLQIYWSVDNPIIHYSPLATKAASSTTPPRDLDAARGQGASLTFNWDGNWDG